MFILVKIDDDIPVSPEDFREPTELQIKREIQARYVDHVVPNVGLCVEFYDFVKIKEAVIYPGDLKLSFGEAHFKVEFRLIVFQPYRDEWLIGRITESNTHGLVISLGNFFHDVKIPSKNLQTPYVFDASQRWVWQYRCQETDETINYFYNANDFIRFRVVDVMYPEPTGEISTRPQVAMVIEGAVDGDGLGCVSWWPDAPQLQARALNEIQDAD